VAAINVVCRRRSETVGSSGLRGIMATAAAAAQTLYCWRIRLQSIRRRGNRLNRAQCGALGTFFRRRRRRRRIIRSLCRDFSFLIFQCRVRVSSPIEIFADLLCSCGAFGSRRITIIILWLLFLIYLFFLNVKKAGGRVSLATFQTSELGFNFRSGMWRRRRSRREA